MWMICSARSTRQTGHPGGVELEALHLSQNELALEGLGYRLAETGSQKERFDGLVYGDGKILPPHHGT
jgi:hypothetical protein